TGGAEPARIYLGSPSVHAGLTVPAPTEPARIYLSPPSVHAGLTVPAPTAPALVLLTPPTLHSLLPVPAPAPPALPPPPLVVLAWLVWDTGADPVRLALGLPWILDFLRRMMPPDPSVLPAALLGAIKTVEIALLGTVVAAVLALPLGFLSARNVAPGAVFYPARAVLNFFRSVDTLVYALVFVAAVGLGPFPGVLAVVAYTTTSLAKLYSEA